MVVNKDRSQNDAPDDDFLLMDWIDALIFEMAARHLLFCRFHVSLADPALDAIAWGGRLILRVIDRLSRPKAPASWQYQRMLHHGRRLLRHRTRPFQMPP
jgi:SHS2 domain-containing protein